jgi:hypothetical protein
MNNLAQKYLKYQNDCKSCGKESCNEVYDNKIIPSDNNEVCTNSGFNFGISSNLEYDPQYTKDSIVQSTSPMLSTMDPNRISNCNRCLSLNGPRASHNGWGDSIVVENPGIAPAQKVTDIESILLNLNVKNGTDGSKKGTLNPVDVFKFETYDATLCNKDLDPLDTLQTYPKQLYREMSINRFYDLNKNPQENIYYSWTENSQLTAKDNYDNPFPYVQPSDETLPNPIKGKSRPCRTVCKDSCNVKVLNRNPDVSDSEEDDYYTDEASSDSESEN